MTIRARDGVTRLYFRDGGFMDFPEEDYSLIRDAFANGERFYQGPGLHGGEAMVKLAEVNAVRDLTADAFHGYLEDERAEKVAADFS